jgi:short-subunit dehydrogenase
MPSLVQRYPGAALVTGASAGIGKAFAQHCAAEGMDVVLVARRRNRLEMVARELETSYGVKAHVIEADLAELSAPEKIHRECEALGVQMSLLVNNAGFGTFAPFHESDLQSQLALVDVNMRAPVALANLFVPPMVARGNGAVVFVSSTAGFQPTPMLAVYGASKAFNHMLGESLYNELKPHGVDCISIAPGYTRTEFHETAAIHRLPGEEMFRTPEHIVATCFENLGKQPSVVDRVGPLEARRLRARRKLERLVRGARVLLRATASAGILHFAELAMLF